MFTLFKANPARDAAERAYRSVVEQSRQTVFYAELGVPDTIDGRFDLICLHAFLYLRRLQREQPEVAEISQFFVDAMFADFDRGLREMGTGDLSVGRQIKRMAQAFYGRIAAYEEGLATVDDGKLRAALERNLFGTAPADAANLAAMAAHVRAAAARLDLQDAAALRAGEMSFGAPPPVQTSVAAEGR
ncbi:MAG TPA: ubiquinol-cytochrome C chaperone family protein [Stellaceae bacterium]|nr:ubiquinol-cytochrome C chaperone family protein [Stellaceae bacterium]